MYNGSGVCDVFCSLGDMCNVVPLAPYDTIGLFTTGMCSDNYGRQVPCCYNTEPVPGLVAGCSGACYSSESWASSNYTYGKLMLIVQCLHSLVRFSGFSVSL